MMIGYLLGAGLMVVGGVFEMVLGVRAERQTLESIAKPLTAEDTPSEGPRPGRAHGTPDRQAKHERDQIVRALQDEGPQHREGVGRLVGARYWDRGRFDRALTHAVSDGLVMQLNDGRYGVT